MIAKTTNLSGEVAPVFGGGAGALVVLDVEHLARLRPPQELELAFRLLGLHRRRFTVSLHVNSSVSRLFLFSWSMCVWSSGSYFARPVALPPPSHPIASLFQLKNRV